MRERDELKKIYFASLTTVLYLDIIRYSMQINREKPIEKSDYKSLTILVSLNFAILLLKKGEIFQILNNFFLSFLSCYVFCFYFSICFYFYRYFAIFLYLYHISFAQFSGVFIFYFISLFSLFSLLLISLPIDYIISLEENLEENFYSFSIHALKNKKIQHQIANKWEQFGNILTSLLMLV